MYRWGSVIFGTQYDNPSLVSLRQALTCWFQHWATVRYALMEGDWSNMETNNATSTSTAGNAV